MYCSSAPDFNREVENLWLLHRHPDTVGIRVEE